MEHNNHHQQRRMNMTTEIIHFVEAALKLPQEYYSPVQISAIVPPAPVYLLSEIQYD